MDQKNAKISTIFQQEPIFNPIEGVIPSDLLSINRILEIKGWFSIAEYNETLERFKFTSYERNDKPYPLPSSKSVKKLRGKAVSNWGSHSYIKEKFNCGEK